MCFSSQRYTAGELLEKQEDVNPNPCTKNSDKNLNPPKPLLNCLCLISASSHCVHLLLAIQIKPCQHTACCPPQKYPSFGPHFTSPACASRYPNEQRAPAACGALFFRDGRNRAAEPRGRWCVFVGSKVLWGNWGKAGVPKAGILLTQFLVLVQSLHQPQE